MMVKQSDRIRSDIADFAYEHGRAPSRKLHGAYHAERNASNWHQGSGIHAGTTLALAEEHEARITSEPQRATEHRQARDAWIKATKEEAKHLKTTQGEHIGLRSWKKTPSGQATKEATALSRKLGVNADDYY